MHKAESPTRGHLPSLDGLRAISIVMVLAGHLSGTRNLGAIPGFAFFGDLAHLGVVVFFVISGFLITGLLMREHEKTGRISLKLFYARRALRIFPASYTFLAIAAVLSALGLIVLARHDLLFGIAYIVNYKIDRAWFIGHLWSLSVEEQFYLLWPFTFAIVAPRWRGWAAAAFVAMGPVARILNWIFLRKTPYYDLEMFPMVADTLAAGCLLAVLRGWLETQPRYLRLFRPLPSFIIVAVVLTLNRFMARTVVSVFGAVAINILLAALIHRSVYCWRDMFGRFLNNRQLAFIGLLSYSLYLWQQPFLNRTSTAWSAAFPQNLVLAVSVALMSYFLLEKPLMRLRSRLRVVG
jgi:peptidoglycan/LPS O-acetylase OafA/YrhL